MIDSKNYMNW